MIERLKANMLIKNNIIGFKEIWINISISFTLIPSYTVIIPRYVK